jgi:hypothetical protein
MNNLDRLRRTAAALTLAGLLGFAAACGTTGGDSDSDSGSAAAPAAPAATTAAAEPTGDKGAPVEKGDMAGACDTVHQLFAALGGGDKTTAQSLKKKGMDQFNDIAAASATKDQQLASDAAAMASMLEVTLPPEPIYESELALTYKVDCVNRYGAAALPG